MTTELKPCPFCGGEAQVGWTDFDSGVIFVDCETCGMYCEPKDCYANEQKAIEAWNTRADENDFAYGNDAAYWHDEYEKLVRAVAVIRDATERTCELEINIDMTAVVCTRCGYEMPKGTKLHEVNYCLSCGAKVVD